VRSGHAVSHKPRRRFTTPNITAIVLRRRRRRRRRRALRRRRCTSPNFIFAHKSSPERALFLCRLIGRRDSQSRPITCLRHGPKGLISLAVSAAAAVRTAWRGRLSAALPDLDTPWTIPRNPWLSHADTVVPQCLNNNNASQWERDKFDPRYAQNPCTDSH